MILVVGAGFAGAVVARELAEAGLKVLVVEQRDHIGGNAYDELDEHGILVHRYGPHLFHTQSERLFAYLSRFTTWRAYEHRVLARVAGKLVPLPINRTKVTGAPIPFGGMKQSGLGREGSRLGIEAFSDVKYICRDWS